MTHIEQRLAERNIQIATTALWDIARKIGFTPTAVLLGKVPVQGSQDCEYRNRTESNGELVILIVRDSRPVTVMFRRDNQPFTAQALKVNQVLTVQ